MPCRAMLRSLRHYHAADYATESAMPPLLPAFAMLMLRVLLLLLLLLLMLPSRDALRVSPFRYFAFTPYTYVSYTDITISSVHR